MITSERSVTARLVAKWMSDVARNRDASARLAAGAVVVICEWESPSGEVTDRLAVHAKEGNTEAIVLIRKGQELRELLSARSGDVPPGLPSIPSRDIHRETPIGAVWDAVDAMSRKSWQDDFLTFDQFTFAAA